MVIIVNSKIEEGKLEFENKNYEKALRCFDEASNDEENDFIQIYKYDCLMNLKRYGDALNIINSVISKYPYSETFWKCKARCHIFLDENQKALKALSEVERVCNDENKKGLVDLDHLYNLLDEYDKVIEYCDKALAIDGAFKPALYEKVMVASSLKDDEMIDSVTADFLNISDNDLFGLLPVFTLNLFSKKYGKCLEIVNACRMDDAKKQHGELLKGVIYQNICEDLNAQIGLSKKYDLSVDDAINLMLEFKKTGKDHGTIHGVEYYIL